MSSTPSACFDTIFEGSGVVRFSIAAVDEVDPLARQRYDQWLAKGHNGYMDYLQRYDDVRNNPALLLPGARSIICCAFAYTPPRRLPPMKARIASYALGTDYHEVVREKLLSVAEKLREATGGETRVCVDTAPLRERYWAQRSGLGFIGCNNHLFLPGLGSCFFLGEILTTAQLPPTPVQVPDTCLECGRCVKACPTAALSPDGAVNASRCLSYLTIEHRGPFPEGTDLHGQLYGCDICAAVCPLNANAMPSEVLPELQPRPELLQLSVENAASLSQAEFSRLFSHSAIKRTKLAGLVRNADSILSETR